MKPRQLRSIEGARGVAASSVLVYHAAQLSPGHGWLESATSRLWVGVPLFFLLSGFLLFRPFAHAVVHEARWPSLSRYAKARMLRIVPAYWVALSVSIMVEIGYMKPALIGVAAVAAWVWSWSTRRRPWLALLLTIVGLPLLLIRWHDAWAAFMNFFLVYVPFGPYTLMGVSWTLCIEVSFYVALPVVAAAAAVWARRGRSPAQRAARLAAPLLFTFPVAWLFVRHVGVAQPLHLWLPAFGDQFAIGMLLAVALEVRPRITLRQSRLALAAAIGVTVLANVLCFSLGPTAPYGNGSGLWFGRLMALAFALALASVLARGEDTTLGRLLTSRLLGWAGVISYGLYLWHPFVIDQLKETPLWHYEWADVLLVAAGSIACATLSWFVVERPALRLKDRPWRRPRTEGATSDGSVDQTPLEVLPASS